MKTTNLLLKIVFMAILFVGCNQDDIYDVTDAENLKFNINAKSGKSC